MRPRVRGVAVDEVDDLLHRRAGQEDARDADRVQLRHVDVRDDAADHDQHVVSPFSRSSSIDPRADVHVRAGQDGQADHIRVLLQRRGDDLLRRLAQAGVDHLHAGVAQRPGDDLGAAVVAVEARLGDDDSDFLAHSLDCGSHDPHCRQIIGVSTYSPQTSRRPSHISPTVA